MQQLDSALRGKSPKATVSSTDEFPISGDGQKIPITLSQLDISDHSDSIKTEEVYPQEALSFESIVSMDEDLLGESDHTSGAEKRPIRMVTWNVDEKKAEEEIEQSEETLSMLGRRKLKTERKQVRAEKRREEAKSWKLWFWTNGCPCLSWSPIYLFQGNDDDQTSVASSKCDQSSIFVTLDEDGDDDSSIPSFSIVGSTLDESTVELDGNVSNVSSSSSDGSSDLEMEEEEAPPPPKPNLEVNIVKDWSREGLSKNTIHDMDVYIDAMRS